MPERGTLVFWTVTAAFLATLGFAYAHLQMSPDQALFSYIGWQVTEGATLYVDVGEQNWPGAMWLHAAAIATFGPVPWAWRVLELIILGLAVFSLGRLLPGRGDRLQGRLLWWIYPVMYAAGGIWFSGQRDIVAGHLLVIAAAAFAARLKGGRIGHVLVLSGAFFLAIMLRPTFLLFGPLLILVAIVTREQTGATGRHIARIAAATAGAVSALVGLTLLAGQLSGSLQEFWEQSIEYNLVPYQDYPFSFEFLRGYLAAWGLALPAAFVALLAWLRTRSEWVGAGVLGAVTITGGVSFVVMGKGFGYHLGALHPVLGALVTVGAAGALRIVLQRGQVVRRGTAGVLCLLVAGALMKNITIDLDEPLKWMIGRQTASQMRQRQVFGGQLSAGDEYEVAAYIRAHSPPDATVLTMTRLPLVNYLAQRRMPLRWSNPGVLEKARAPFEHAERWQRQAIEGLDRHPPAMIVASQGDDGRLLLSRSDHPPTPFVSWLEKAVAGDYRQVARFGSLTLWARR